MVRSRAGPPGRGLGRRWKDLAERQAPGTRPLTAAHLAESIDPLLGGQPVLTIGSYWQYATTLWGYIRRAQPFDEPGSLTADQVYAVTAYLLYLNGIIGEQDVVDARSLPQIRMPNRNGFVPDARPDVGKTKVRTPSPERTR
jgi:cytochrome c